MFSKKDQGQQQNSSQGTKNEQKPKQELEL
jgi:hypothetical protein